MKKTVFLILLLLSAIFNAPAQTEVSYKQQAWDLGNYLSLAAMVNAASSDAADIKPIFTLAKTNAKSLGIILPDLPSRTNDKIKDKAVILNYLINSAGAPIMKTLRENFGAQHAALFEISFMTNILFMLYAPDGKETAAIVSVINKRSETADLPTPFFSELMRLIAAKADSNEIKNEIVRLQETVSAYVGSIEFGENGEILYERKDYAKSAAAFSRAIQLMPDEPVWYFLRAKSYMQINKCPEAIADYTKVIRFANPEKEPAIVSDIYHNRGLCYEILKKYTPALADLNMAVKLNPKNALVYKTRSLVYKQLGKPKLAEADYQKAENLQPGIMKTSP